MKSIFIVDSYTIYVVRVSGNGLTDNNSNKTVITGEFRALTRIHEHDFSSIRTEKEQTTFVCSTCGLVYCEKCGKLVMVYDNVYMKYGKYN